MAMKKAPGKGKAGPDRMDVIKAANASDDAKGLADENVLPATGGPSLDRAGIQDSGYLDKKGTPSGVDVFFNCLPPGMNIEDQYLADIREEPIKYVTDLGYPGDGWS
jgi:hypothetical protein